MYGIPSHHQPLSCVFHTRVIVHYPKWCIQNISVIFIDMVECNIVYLQSTEEMGISLDFWLYSKYFMALRVIWQYMDRSVTNKILYGPKLLSPFPVHITLYWPAALTKTNRENKNVKYNIFVYYTIPLVIQIL
jgi:hypothetical protein